MLGYSLLPDSCHTDVLFESSEHAQSGVLVGGWEQLAGGLTKVSLVLLHHVTIPQLSFLHVREMVDRPGFDGGGGGDI